MFQPKYEMGRTAVKILLDEIGIQAGSTNPSAADRARMKKSAESSRRVVILEPRLIVRKSSIAHLTRSRKRAAENTGHQESLTWPEGCR